MSDNPTKETVSQVLDLLLGDANGPKGHLTNAVREQIMPEIMAKVEGMDESIQTLREAHAKGPPSNENAVATGRRRGTLPPPRWAYPTPVGTIRTRPARRSTASLRASANTCAPSFGGTCAA